MEGIARQSTRNRQKTAEIAAGASRREVSDRRTDGRPFGFGSRCRRERVGEWGYDRRRVGQPVR
jgi:hypothetical protein